MPKLVNQRLKPVKDNSWITIARTALALISFSAVLLSCSNSDSTAGNGQETFLGDMQTIQGEPIQFLSTQLFPTQETDTMRTGILENFSGRVDFQPNNSSYLFDTVQERLDRNPDASILLGGLHGEFSRLYHQGQLRPLDDVYASLVQRGFREEMLFLARFDGEHIYYIPWMQATYLFVINRKAMSYLPAGVDLDRLSYEQLREWAERIKRETGSCGLGFPASDQGLMHRFIQGYLYPSFTGSTLAKFRSDQALNMWHWFADLWESVNPKSLWYDSMDDALIREEILIAWDHTARLSKAFENRPGTFIAIPPPIGPAGRGFIPVFSGLAIPSGVKTTGDSTRLIDYLLQPSTQLKTMITTGFFPVIPLGKLEIEVPEYLESMHMTMQKQMTFTNGVPTLLPVGLGRLGDAYNRTFMLTFSDIVLGKMELRPVLDSNAEKLQAILEATKVPFWLPDNSDEEPGKIE